MHQRYERKKGYDKMNQCFSKNINLKKIKKKIRIKNIISATFNKKRKTWNIQVPKKRKKKI